MQATTPMGAVALRVYMCQLANEILSISSLMTCHFRLVIAVKESVGVT